MLNPQRFLAGLGLALLGALSLPAQIIWSGLGATGDITDGANWIGAVPPNNGTGLVYLEFRFDSTLVLPTSYTLQTIYIAGDKTFYVDGSGPQTLTLTAGIFSLDDNVHTLWFLPNIALHLLGDQILDTRGGLIIVSGAITGVDDVSLYNSSGAGTGAFIFNNTGAGNTYSGNTFLGDGVNPVVVAFWNSAPFGTGTVFVNTPTAAAQLITHGTQTIANPFTLSGPGLLSFKSWDAPVTYSGLFTLGGNATFNPSFAPKAVSNANNTAVIPTPGPPSRNPVILSGGITGTGIVTFTGSGVTILSGVNNYSGTTTINGNVVLATLASGPTQGGVYVGTGGYLGLADTTPGVMGTFLSNYFNISSIGAIGYDTLPGSPTATFTDNLNLIGLSSQLRIGTATSAILTGTLTPTGSVHQFGNGGGVLTVASALTGTRSLSLNSTSGVFPLSLVLKGANTYNGGTTVNNGFLVFDGANTIPAVGSLTAGGSSLFNGASYIGYTDAVGITPLTFLNFFDVVNTWGTVGFDSATMATISNLNMSAFNDGVFIGTSSNATLTGTLTPTGVANVDNAPNTLRFTAVKDGTLTVASTLSGTTAVMVGTTSSVGQYSSGVINLSGPNTYSGGTTLNTFNPAATPTLGFGSNSALGTGALDVLSDSSAMAGLQATNAGLTLSNPINLITVGVGGFGPKLFFSGSNDYTLSGAITGDDTTSLYMFSQTGLSVSLSGNNVGFVGNIYLPKGTLNFLSDNAAGGGTLDFGDASLGNAFFSSANPVLYGLTGTSGSIILGGTTNLILDASIGTHDFNYAGGISGTGGLTITAPMATSASAVALRGSSSYSGGTTVLNYGVVALDQSDSLGTGTVTLNAPNGGILVGPAVTMTNPLTFTSGALAGFGTYDPTGTATLTFNTGHIVSPGTGILFDGSGVSATGELTLATDVTFANGGSYVWTLQDVNRPDGYSLLNISGNLAITATSGGFVLKIATFDSSNFLGDANLLLGQPYTLPIITTTGSITGFSTSAFTIDASLFQSGAMAPSMFALTQSGSTIYLTFTAVPEPSTYALLALGLGAVFVPLRRRRKS